MCGIAGIVRLNRKNCCVEDYLGIIKRMTDSIAHRGPDGEGHMCLDDGHVFLGHRRLAVLDLSDNGKQPMTTSDGRFTVVYNGEIYNYLKLRAELERLGHKFWSNTDTEVVLHAYTEWGNSAVLRFNGIFAFALWDNKEKELFICRDRYGVKPLYYTVIGDDFVFASEYKAFLEMPGFKRTLDKLTLKEYFTFQNIFSNRTFLENVYIVTQGTFMTIGYCDSNYKKENRYWDYCFNSENENFEEREYEEELKRLFEQAVKRQLVSDVEIGSYLSGGIDSGAITAVASKDIKGMKSFTCGFDLHSATGMELAFDEREKAEYMSYLFGTEHYEMVLKAGDMERCINQLVWHVEDPRVGQSYPNLYAAKLASNFVKVVLAGSGGDEIFAGYPWRYYKILDCRSFDQYISGYYDYWQRLLKEGEQEEFFSPINSEIKDYSTKEVFASVFKPLQKDNYSEENGLDYALYLEANTFLHGILVVEDKLSMAFGLETRVPFLDNDLVDFALKVPSKYKLKGNALGKRIDENEVGDKYNIFVTRYGNGKYILRNAMRSYLPDEILHGKKQGFSAPDASWFRGESIEFVRDIVTNSNARIYDYINQKSVMDIVEKHMEGKKNNRLIIWAILNFEKWLEAFL